MKIYLDSCAYNRPYDDLSYLTISLEAQAKLQIQEDIKNDKYQLVSSEILMYEIDECPIEMRRNVIREFVETNTAIHVGESNSNKIKEMAQGIMGTGIKYKDACHIASAVLAECDYFISTDRRLLKYQSEKIALVNPVEFIAQVEEDNNDK